MTTTQTTTADSAPLLNRRRFIAASALAGAGLVLAPRSLSAQNANVPSNEKKKNALNIAVVGCGEQGNALLNSINGIRKNNSPADRIYKDDFRLVALADIWPWKLKAIFNAQKRTAGWTDLQSFGRIEELLAAKDKLGLDAVFVATPDHWHSRHTVLALNAGLHVYCEKMMARNATEARAMVLASRHRPNHKDDATKKLLQIGHQRRSNPNYRFAYDVLLRRYQYLGRITNANGQWNRAISQSQDIVLAPGPLKTLTADILKASEFDVDGNGKPYTQKEAWHHFRNWRWFKKYSNGPISDLGAHQIDIFNWVFGRPRSVIAAGGNRNMPLKHGAHGFAGGHRYL
jgi:predicted dehydrogenase